MKRQSLVVVVLAAFAAFILLPNIASAQHRFGTDRGSRYSVGGHGHSGHGYRGHSGYGQGYGSSKSYWNVSVGFGSGYHNNGWYGTSFSFGRSPTYYRGGYARYYAPSYYAPAPIYYAPRVVYAAPPVVYYPPPVYTSSYYYSSGYYCR